MEFIILAFSIVNLLITLVLVIVVSKKKGADSSQLIDKIETAIREESRLQRSELSAELSQSRREVDTRLMQLQKTVSDTITSSMKSATDIQYSALTKLSQDLTQSLEAFRKTVVNMTTGIDNRMQELTLNQEKRLESIRNSVELKLTAIQNDTQKKLDEMRQTVDEKLQKTLDERVGQSFKIVSDRLELVHKGLGEMQTLASGVGDLKKVLSNVKTRGIMGEIQLGRILDQIMTPAQYETNVITKKGSQDAVEYAIKLPGKDDTSKSVYLPIDAKFPMENYRQLIDAYDAADTQEIEKHSKNLESVIKNCAKTIFEKYIDPPNTTDFAVMFLPVEGLYAEVVRRTDLLEFVAREYRINIAGPTTLAALLNSLQMGFKTLTIEKRSHEVWNLLAAVKTEFNNFAKVLENTQKHIEAVSTDIDTLVGVRTRKIVSKLRKVEELPAHQAEQILNDSLDD